MHVPDTAVQVPSIWHVAVGVPQKPVLHVALHAAPVAALLHALPAGQERPEAAVGSPLAGQTGYEQGGAGGQSCWGRGRMRSERLRLHATLPIGSQRW